MVRQRKSLAKRSRCPVRDASASPQTHEATFFTRRVTCEQQKRSSLPPRTPPHQLVSCATSICVCTTLPLRDVAPPRTLQLVSCLRGRVTKLYEIIPRPVRAEKSPSAHTLTLLMSSQSLHGLTAIPVSFRWSLLAMVT